MVGVLWPRRGELLYVSVFLRHNFFVDVLAGFTRMHACEGTCGHVRMCTRVYVHACTRACV